MLSTKALLQTFGAPTRTNEVEEEQKLPSTEEEKLALYKRKLALHEKHREERIRAGGTELFEHEFQFVDDAHYFKAATVARELEKAHASAPHMKGVLIAGFNACHSSTNGPIEPSTDFSKHIHHGTSRIFNRDGSFNQLNWDALVNFVKERQSAFDADIIRLSTLEAFVKHINDTFGYEADSGRKHVMTSFIQDAAGAGARKQLFEVLSCGYKKLPNDFSKTELCMKLSDLELFFRDSKAAFLKAECGLLPINKELPIQLLQPLEAPEPERESIGLRR